MAVHVNKAFTGANGTAITTYDSNFAEIAGTVTIESNQANCSAGGPGKYNYGVSIGSADYKVSADMVTALAGQHGMLYFRNQSAGTANYYRAYWEYGGTNSIALAKFVASVETVLGSWNTTHTMNDTVNMKVQGQGTTIKVLTADTERISVTDSAHTLEGDPGFQLGSNRALDNFKVEDFVPDFRPKSYIIT